MDAITLARLASGYTGRFLDLATPQGRQMRSQIEGTAGFGYCLNLCGVIGDAAAHLQEPARSLAEATVTCGLFTHLMFSSDIARDPARLDAAGVQSAFHQFKQRQVREFVRVPHLKRFFDLCHDELLGIDKFERSLGHGWFRRTRNRKHWQSLFGQGLMLGQLGDRNLRESI